ncbi:papain-like cysteine protease family protein [Paenibacillus sp. strain BS8-2]
MKVFLRERLKIRNKVVFIATFISFFALSLVTQVYAGNIANYPAHQQGYSNWCWAASSTSILDYYDIVGTQCGIVQIGNNSKNCPNVTGSVYDAQDALDHFGVSSDYYNGSLSWSNIQDQIDSGLPIYVSWGWTAGGGHAVVIYGYSNSGSYVNYMDPATGTKTSMTLTSFTGGSSSDRIWRWGLNNITE